MRGFLALSALFCLPPDDAPMPKPAEGWSIELVKRAPEILYPTAVVVARDGTIYLGQDPMDMPGPPTSPIDSVVSIRDGKVSVFADKLWSVMGLEWVDGTLFVVHAPFLSAFRDKDGDGRADERVDLVTGLGPKLPGFNGINDHVASGLRLGIDGFLYVAVGDKGLPRAVGSDGATATMSSGGVIRVRPDGTGLEVVSTGERNPLSVALTDRDDVFTYGNDDDSKKWPNSLTHHVVGGHYGYPYEFLIAPERALPIVAGQLGGSGTQGLCYNEDGLPERFRGNLFFCDWGLQAVHRFEVKADGATFKLVRREPIVEKGALADFRPFSIAVDGASMLVVDWAYNGWLADGPKTGRLYRLTYTGSDAVEPSPRPKGTVTADLLESLDHPSLSVRLDSQRALASRKEVGPLSLCVRSQTATGKIHALWALDAINTPEARRLIREMANQPDPAIKAQAARSAGIRRDAEALPILAKALADPDATVRREASIALGKIGDARASAGLYLALGDRDPTVAWSIRHSIRTLNAWDSAALTKALADPARRDDAIKLADESWSIPAVQALTASLAASTEPLWRAKVVAALAGQYRKYPAWSGRWFGTNPLVGAMPSKTENWATEGMDLVLAGLARGLGDGEAIVRKQAVIGLYQVGPRASPLFRAGIDRESDPTNLAAMAQALGVFGDDKAVPALAKILADSARDLDVRASCLDALGRMNSRQATNARMAVIFDQKSPASLVAQALPALGRARFLPSGDLVGFLDHPSDAVKVAALGSFATDRPLPAAVQRTIVARLDDPSPEVRRAAIGSAGVHRISQAIPRLITLAADEPEATRALAMMPDPRAIPVFVEAIRDRDPATRKLGESALMAIRDDATAELESQARQGRFVGPAAMAVERILARFDPVLEWRVIGPFPRTTAAPPTDPAGIDFRRPMPGAEGRDVSWQVRKSDSKTGRVVIDDLKSGGSFGFDGSGSPDLAAYAYAEVSSDRDRPALMLVGSSGTVVVRVNEQWVLNQPQPAGRAYSADSDLIRLPLKAGVNRIMLLTRQGIGPWSFGVQFSTPSSGSLALKPGTVGLEGLRAFAMGHSGDPKNGEAIFFDAKGIGCVKCHAAAGRGKATIGPDLTGLALKYDKAEVVRSVLEPSNRIATGYQPTMIARKDGTVVAGLVRAETAAHLVVIDAEGRIIRMAPSEIEERRVGDVSLMPSGLVDTLSPVEFADLIAYLMSLKQAH